MDTDDLNNPELPYQSPERTMRHNPDQPPNTSKGRHDIVALITDTKYMSYSHQRNHEWTVDSGPSVSMIPSHEIFRDY